VAANLRPVDVRAPHLVPQDEVNRIIGERLREERRRALRSERMRVTLLRGFIQVICEAAEHALDYFEQLDRQLRERELAVRDEPPKEK
jgi:alkanesulfonate monooxygenase SsuD/methylene tetrahydromethanopterin reductase-like flavin-dependent oxidoreductase (luciferase family)